MAHPLAAVFDELKEKLAGLEDELAILDENRRALAVEREEVERTVMELGAYLRAVAELARKRGEANGAAQPEVTTERKEGSHELEEQPGR